MSERYQVSHDNSAPCMWMRGGTSKGGFFLEHDLPADISQRDAFLLAIMGSPDLRQIDGMGGADPLTSKVAVIKKSSRAGIDVDYLFLQVMVEKALVSDAQNCGNILAAVGPFAIERGLVQAQDETTAIKIHMENTNQVATATVCTPQKKVSYEGQAHIDGVPGNSSPVVIEFKDTAGAMCGALLPTGKPLDTITGIDVTLIDNGMPCVLMRARDLGIEGTEAREELEANAALRSKLESIRLQAGRMMNLGDVENKTVPKMTMLSLAKNGGAISTRTFIPHRCHASIGVLGAVSVATGCLMIDTIAERMVQIPEQNPGHLKIEHPLGETTIIAKQDEDGTVTSAAILRTARKLFDGTVFA